MSASFTIADWLKDSINMLELTRHGSPSVAQWLLDLRGVTENECMCILQGKSLTEETSDVTFRPSLGDSSTITNQVCSIYESYGELRTLLDSDCWSDECDRQNLLIVIYNKLETFISGISSTFNNNKSCLDQCEAFRRTSKLLLERPKYITDDLLSITQLLDHLVEYSLTELVKKLLCDVNSTESLSSLQSSVGQLVAIGLQADYLCLIIVQQGGVEKLINLIRSSPCSEQPSNISVLDTQSNSIVAVPESCASNGILHSKTNSFPNPNYSNGVPRQEVVSVTQIPDSQSQNVISKASNSLLSSVSRENQGYNRNDAKDSNTSSSNTPTVLTTFPQEFTIVSQTLRALATVCCVPESLQRLDKSDGVECICRILCSSLVPQTIRSEAAGVIAQIHSPSVATGRPILSIIEHKIDIVEALTNICRDACEVDVFLVCCAALANMTCVDNLTCDYLIQFDTVSALLLACENNMVQSVFARDQIMTVIYNIASIESYCSLLMSTQSLPRWVVTFLNQRTSRRDLTCVEELRESTQSLSEDDQGCEVASSVGNGVHEELTPVELAASERVLQKAAMTISRLSRNRDCAVRFVETNCVTRLVELCTKAAARNQSDTVLMACLTALRKLYTVCGPMHHSALRTNSVRLLIHSDVMQSFLRCSTTNESFI